MSGCLCRKPLERFPLQCSSSKVQGRFTTILGKDTTILPIKNLYGWSSLVPQEASRGITVIVINNVIVFHTRDIIIVYIY